MAAIGAIPARWGSTRFPGKSLTPIQGRPLIAWVVESARRCTRLDDLLVATDDERIAAVVREAGARAVMTRSDHPSGTDRIAEAVAGSDADIVVNIQGDEPLIDASLVDRLVVVMEEDHRWDMATASSPIATREELSSPSVVKVVADRSGRALYFSRSPIPFVRDGGSGEPLAGMHWRHIGLYAYRRSFLETLVATPPCGLEKAEKLEQLRALHIGASIMVVESDGEGIGVDTPADVAYVEAMLRRKMARSGERGKTA